MERAFKQLVVKGDLNNIDRDLLFELKYNINFGENVGFFSTLIDKNIKTLEVYNAITNPITI